MNNNTAEIIEEKDILKLGDNGDSHYKTRLSRD